MKIKIKGINSEKSQGHFYGKLRFKNNNSLRRQKMI